MLRTLTASATLLALACPPAAAQSAAGISADLARALRKYEQRRYAAAAPVFFAIDHDAKRPALSRERAEWWLMKTLYHLKYDFGALAQAERVLRHAKPSRYRAAVGKWLVALARRLPRAEVARVARLLPGDVVDAPILARVRTQLVALRKAAKVSAFSRGKWRAHRCAEAKRVRRGALAKTALGRWLVKTLRCRAAP